MPQQTAEKQDKSTRLIYARLKDRFPDLPTETDKVVYRYSPAWIRVRVVDTDFAGMTYTQRKESIADILTALPATVRTDIT